MLFSCIIPLTPFTKGGIWADLLALFTKGGFGLAPFTKGGFRLTPFTKGGRCG